MKLMMLITADYASIDKATGKLNVLGAFSRIMVKEIPAEHPRMALVLKIRPELGDHAKERILTIDLIGEDGTDYFQISGPFELPYGQGGIRPEFNAVIELNQLKFPKTGIYEFRVSVDGEKIDDTTIEVIQSEQPLG